MTDKEFISALKAIIFAKPDLSNDLLLYLVNESMNDNRKSKTRNEDVTVLIDKVSKEGLDSDK